MAILPVKRATKFEIKERDLWANDRIAAIRLRLLLARAEHRLTGY